MEDDLNPEWPDRLWAELVYLEPEDQVRVSGEWISYITHELLPALASRRRSLVAEVVDRPDWTPSRLAETIGSTESAMKRLATEGRKLRGQQDPDSSSGVRGQGT
jgi:hypothetical protein